MQPNHAKIAIVVGWIVGLSALAWSTAPASVGGWTLVLGWALIPPLMLIRLRKQQEQTTSDSIREVLR